MIDVPMEDLECTTVDVPLDYDGPDGETIELFVSKRPAIADEPIGPLFVNQGGPGASAADYAASIGAYGGLDRFDIIGMDPRGTGRSTHLDCSIEAGEHVPELATEPDAEPTAYELEIEASVDACAQDPRLPHFGTNNTTRDIDHIRELLDEEQITYHGKSYGSDLGAAYLSLFPERVRAAVLDGATDLTLEPVDFLVQQTEATERQLDRYLEHCESEGCPWTGDTAPRQAWDDLMTQLEESPIVDEQTGDTFTANDLAELPQAFLETPAEEVDLLLEAMVVEGDVADLIDEVDLDDIELITAFIAITCLDLPLDDTQP